MFKIYLIGTIILFTAIILNVIVQRFGIMGWYEFLTKLQGIGKITFSTMVLVDYLWLFVGYPLCLGFSSYLGEKLYDILISVKQNDDSTSFGIFTYPPGKGIKSQRINSESFEVLLIHLFYCKISPYIHLVTAVTVTVVIKVSFLCLNRQNTRN